jgi:hypothetical protein
MPRAVVIEDSDLQEVVSTPAMPLLLLRIKIRPDANLDDLDVRLKMNRGNNCFESHTSLLVRLRCSIYLCIT